MSSDDVVVKDVGGGLCADTINQLSEIPSRSRMARTGAGLGAHVQVPEQGAVDAVNGEYYWSVDAFLYFLYTLFSCLSISLTGRLSSLNPTS